VIAAKTVFGPRSWDPFAWVDFMDCTSGECAAYDQLDAATLAALAQANSPQLIDTPSGHTVTTSKPINAQQQACLQSEIQYADRTMNDALNAASIDVGYSTLKGMGTGLATGGYAGFTTGELFGGEITLGATGVLGGIAGGAIGAGIGGMTGSLSGLVNLGKVFLQNASLPFVPSWLSTYDSNLQSNAQKVCGVSVTVK
jgi:hypothetical protein